MYGLTAGVSVGQLYMAGVVPGLLLAGLFIAYIMIRCYLQPHLAPAASIAARNITLAEKFALLRGLILPGLVAFSVLGSLYLGLATPTEAAGVGCVGAFLSAAVNRRLTWENVTRAVADTTRVTFSGTKSRGTATLTRSNEPGNRREIRRSARWLMHWETRSPVMRSGEASDRSSANSEQPLPRVQTTFISFPAVGVTSVTPSASAAVPVEPLHPPPVSP